MDGSRSSPDFPSVPEEVPYEPPRLILATDLHYQSAQADDGGAAFQLFVERGDGKVVEYLPELLEAFMDQVIEEHPSALVLSGDITMNGEKINHEELARGLCGYRTPGFRYLLFPETMISTIPMQPCISVRKRQRQIR